MTAETKTKAYEKIDNMVVNVGYDIEIEDDAYIAAYYQGFTIPGKYTTFLIYLLLFLLRFHLLLLEYTFQMDQTIPL